MNLTPLYVMDRMMVGTFFMCSVDFCRNMGCGLRTWFLHGTVGPRWLKWVSPCLLFWSTPPTYPHFPFVILMLCVWLFCLRMSCACLVSVEANRGYRILLDPELWMAVTASVGVEN